MEQLIIRPMKHSDIDAVHAIEVACFPRPWSKDAFYKELDENVVALYLVATIGEKLVAFGGMWMVISEAQITNIAVHENYRKQGIGRKMITKLKETANDLMGIEDMVLEVRVSNTPAIGLYESMGFEKVGIRPKYYEDNKEDAYVMVCKKLN